MRSKPVNPPSIATLILLTGLSVLSLNMFLPSLPSMAGEFGVSYARMSLSISGFFALTSVLQLIIGPLSDQFGRRPVMLTGVALFALASVVCAIAPNDTVFLTARIAQCAIVVGGALPPAIVRDCHNAQDSARLIALIGTAMALAPMLGPIVGGLLDYALGWRAIFALYSVLGGVALWLVWTGLGETNPNLGRSFRDQIAAYPMVITSLKFWANALCMSFSASVFFVFLSGAPLVAETYFGVPTALLGLAMATTPLGFMFGTFLTSRLTGRIGLPWIMIIGRSIAFAGLVVLLPISFGDPSLWLYFALTVPVGIGNGMTFPPGYSGVMSVKPEVAGSASGLTGSLLVGMGSVTTALAATLLSPENAVYMLVIILLVIASLALIFAVLAQVAETAALERQAQTP